MKKYLKKNGVDSSHRTSPWVFSTRNPINKDMKVVLPIEEGYFNIIPNKFCGLDCYLITPEIDAKWNKNNLFYRSLITDKEGTVLSSGFPKFFNYGEKPDCYPDPEQFNDWVIEDKQDGSLCIVEFVNGQFSMRTRGTSTYKTLVNYKDFEFLFEKYPKVKKHVQENSNYSFLFEIVTPNNVIVIRPKEIDFYFLGAVDKNTLKMATNEEVLNMWKNMGCPPTPQKYYFQNVKSISQISEFVKEWKGKEGVVLSYNNNQNRIKLKSLWYITIHRIKSQLNSENNLIDFYVECGMPEHSVFQNKIEKEFDFEIAEQLKDEILRISEIADKVKREIEHMKEFAHTMGRFETRKEQARYVMENYGKSKKSSFVFDILDGKELSIPQLTKLMNLLK